MLIDTSVSVNPITEATFAVAVAPGATGIDDSAISRPWQSIAAPPPSVMMHFTAPGFVSLRAATVGSVPASRGVVSTASPHPASHAVTRRHRLMEDVQPSAEPSAGGAKR